MNTLPNNVATPIQAPAKFRLVPCADEMTDDQAEAIAKQANCCGGIAYDIYRGLLDATAAVETDESKILSAVARYQQRDMETQADWCVDYFRELEVADLRAALALRTAAEAAA